MIETVKEVHKSHRSLIRQDFGTVVRILVKLNVEVATRENINVYGS